MLKTGENQDSISGASLTPVARDATTVVVDVLHHDSGEYITVTLDLAELAAFMDLIRSMPHIDDPVNNIPPVTGE